MGNGEYARTTLSLWLCVTGNPNGLRYRYIPLTPPLYSFINFTPEQASVTEHRAYTADHLHVIVTFTFTFSSLTTLHNIKDDYLQRQRHLA
jgi:hypothetical protein